ncbi:MAG: metal ABC transporter solute-binding protein, Zn/Mn family [Porticoccaceae bacterium]
MLKKIQYNTGWLLLLVGSLSGVNLSASSDSPELGSLPTVVTTIKPLAIVAKSAVGDAANVEYLMPASQSPHDFSLPISALQKIAAADLVVWIGRDFETRSAKTMAKLSPTKVISAVQQLSQPGPDEEIVESRDKEAEHSIDPHLWLNPEYANVIAAEIQIRLGLPVKKIIEDTDIQRLKGSMTAFSNKTYLSHHDAYSHFVRAFGLPAGMSIRDARGDVKGVRSQYQLRQTMASANFSCIFVEPQYQSKDAAVIAMQFDLPMMSLDPQGLSQPINKHAYREFMVGMAAQFTACFQ